MADADTKHDGLEPHDGDSTGAHSDGHHAAHEHEHDTEEESASIDSAAFASLEALESGEDAPILPVRAIDDEEGNEEVTDGAEASADDSDNSDDDSDDESSDSDDDSEDSEDAEDAASGEDGAESTDTPSDGSKRRNRRGGRGRKKETQQSAPAGSKRRQLIVVNDVPGEECRIAVLEDGRLEQIFAERENTATHVGNIYKGRVMNVEPAIQAAFIDFGEGQNGFLHISDLHPQYFPGEERTERVGKKIARRDRPPIQEALKRGQEVIVQVLKEGIGTKGPTLTSYVSIPGRLLVMMPQMDKVGVSRKVEDEDQRREMRRILDSLELPAGFGFILRTAGFDRTKTELQRDAIYLQRLWQAMERRMSSTGAPCALYTESDLLVRTIRDIADDSVDAIVVDSESAFTRAKTFLQVVAPINAPRLLFYDRIAPVFEAFGVERQIEQIHAREVPLPSGGALVIDQTEAMVAIDVNSGKSRSARDSETNAFNTNREAVDEIARQLRLRDLGGIIVNDLIDMRMSKHRREIEARLESNLRRDRAKTTTLEISDFGMIEMTRQRMRPGLHKAHFMDCPHCHGAGEVRVPDAVAADILRRIALFFCHDRIARVEVVCSARVAGVFLSTRRNALHELEERSDKRVDIRISDAFAMDRVEVYAYDDRGADIELDRLPRVPAPRLSDLPDSVVVSDDDDGDDDVVDGGGHRRRRRRRKPAPADATAMALAGGFDDLPTPTANEPSVSELIRRSDAERETRRREDDVRKREEDARRREEDARKREEDARLRQEAARERQEAARERQEAAAARAVERAAAREARDAERATRVEAGLDVADLDEADATDAAEEAALALEREQSGGNRGQGNRGEGDGEAGRGRRRRRRRGRGRGGDRDDEAPANGNSGGNRQGGRNAPRNDAAGTPAAARAEGEAGAEGSEGGEAADGSPRGDGGEGSEGGEDGPRKRRRRRRRGGRGRGGDRAEGADGAEGAPSGDGSPAAAGDAPESRPRSQPLGAPQGSGGGRTPREPREPRQPREPRDGRGPREPRGDRGPREPREPRTDRAPRNDAPSAPAQSSNPAESNPAASDTPLGAAKKTIRSVTGWMRRLKTTPGSGGRDDR